MTVVDPSLRSGQRRLVGPTEVALSESVDGIVHFELAVVGDGLHHVGRLQLVVDVSLEPGDDDRDAPILQLMAVCSQGVDRRHVDVGDGLRAQDHA